MRVELPPPFAPTRPRYCRCTVCGWEGSSQRKAREAHLRSLRHVEAELGLKGEGTH